MYQNGAMPRDVAHRLHETEHAIEDLVAEIASHATCCQRLLGEGIGDPSRPHQWDLSRLQALQVARELVTLARDLAEQLESYDRLSVRAGLSRVE